MSRRIMTTENLEEDVRIENHLRPQLLEDYIGQAKAKEMLKIYIEAAKAPVTFTFAKSPVISSSSVFTKISPSTFGASR